MIAINNILSSLTRLTEAPIKSTEMDLDQFIITDTLKSQIQDSILSGNIEINMESIIIMHLKRKLLVWSSYLRLIRQILLYDDLLV
jgi:hypothetical protein